MQQHSDEQLVTLTLNGDNRAFEILVQRYEKQVFALAYRLGGDYDEARDMAQESFLRIYNELPSFDVSRRFFSWMYRVAHNTCINLLHKRPRETAPLEAVVDLARDERVAADPQAAFHQLECGEAVNAALQALPEQYRLPLVLRYLEGMSYQQISESLDLPVSTIETRLFRGRNLLRQALAAYIDY